MSCIDLDWEKASVCILGFFPATSFPFHSSDSQEKRGKPWVKVAFFMVEIVRWRFWFIDVAFLLCSCRKVGLKRGEIFLLKRSYLRVSAAAAAGCVVFFWKGDRLWKSTKLKDLLVSLKKFVHFNLSDSILTWLFLLSLCLFFPLQCLFILHVFSGTTEEWAALEWVPSLARQTAAGMGVTGSVSSLPHPPITAALATALII